MLVAWSTAVAVGAQSPRAVLPDEVAIAVEVTDPPAVLAELFLALGPVPPDLPESVRGLLGVGLTAVRVWLQASPTQRVEELAHGGLALGLLPGGRSPEPLLALRPGDLPAAVSFLERFAQVTWSRDGDWLLAAATTGGCERLRQRVQQGPGRWADWPVVDGAPGLRVFFDLQRLRELAPEPQRTLLPRLDGGGRFLFGPLAAAIDAAPRAQVDVRGGECLRVSATLPAGHGDGLWSRLLPAASRPRMVLAPPPDALAMVAPDRSLHALFADLAVFLPPADVVAAQGFLSVADQLDGAATSFVDDLLGALPRPWTLYVLPGTDPPDAEEPRSPLLLPAFALVAEVTDGKVEPILRRMAQILVVIANTERAQAGKKPFVLQPLALDGARGFVAEPTVWRGPGAPPVEQSLTPTLLLGHGHVVLASTRAAAQAMLAQAGANATVEVTGDVVQVWGAPLAAAVARSRAPLEFARMLDEGEDVAAAQRFWATFQALAGNLERASFALRIGKDASAAELELRRRR